MPLHGSLDGEAGITLKRRCTFAGRFFAATADALAETSPALAECLQRITGRARGLQSLQAQAVQLRRAQACRGGSAS
jgi:hypothetical protein